MCPANRASLLLSLAVLLLGGCSPSAWKLSHPPAWKHAVRHRLAAGYRHTCTLRLTGTVRCWGDNSAGQLGDGTADARFEPVTVRGLDDAISLAAGMMHSCALRHSGAVACWGDNSAGQLGRSPEQIRGASTPQNVQGLPVVVEIVAGGNFACARTQAGTVLCWGSVAAEVTSRYGSVDLRSIALGQRPTVIKGLKQVIRLAAGGQHLCALHRSGEVSCFGRNTAGQLGDGSEEDRPSPVRVQGLKDAAAITAGGAHTCALHRSGAVSCWGDNDDGRVSGMTAPYHATPLPLAVEGVLAHEVVAGGEHTCARRRTGAVTCWGKADASRLTLERISRPVYWQPREAQRLGDTIELAAGGMHSCVLRPGGEVDCWGDNSAGQLGRGDRPLISTTPRTVVDISQAAALTTGAKHTCALLANGQVRCWGDNNYRQSGGFKRPFSSTPVLLEGLANVTLIAAGYGHSCAREASGRLLCFGVPFDASPQAWPPRPIAGARPFQAVALGYYFGCGLEASGLVRCWGDNSDGQLGRGVRSQIYPRTALPPVVPVIGLAQASGIAVGRGHTCAVRTNGDIACWGINTAGQCAVDPLRQKNVLRPSRVEGLPAKAKVIAARGAHTCALLHSGQVFCWGSNEHGQLGDGTSEPIGPPVPAQGIHDAIAIGVGENDSCAVHASGQVSCWGERYGRTPRLAPGLSAAIEVAVGDWHVCARLRSGEVRCSGNNASGQLGDGSQRSSLVAAPVRGL